MDAPIRILMLEDDAADAELEVRELRKAGLSFTSTLARDKPTFLEALDTEAPDIVLADYSVPGFDGLSALTMAREHFGQIPVIIVSGAIGEERAIETLKAGATDYVLKHRLSRLAPVVCRAPEEARQLAERRHAEEALRESREQFRLLVQGVEEYALFMLDPDGRVVSWNPGAERIKGWRAEEIIGRHFSAFYRLEEIAAGKPERELAIAAREGSYEEESHRLRKDGAVFWAAVSITALRDEHGRLRGFAKMIRDITERKHAEQQLRELNESLEQRVAERTAEVQGLAEQLRALASQLSQTEQRERKRLARILHDHIQQILVAARMRLAFVDPEEDKDQVRSTVADVLGLLQEAIDASRSLAVDLSPPLLHAAGLIGGLKWLASRMQERYRLTVRVLSHGTAEPGSEDMRLLLFECVRELLLNVVKHAGVSEADVVVMRTEDDQIRIAVHDRGKGFDPDLFRNRQPDEVTFGLFSIQQRLGHMGGRMDIKTASGRGTTVTLMAPLKQPAASAQEAPEGNLRP